MEDEGLYLEDLDLTSVANREELAELLRTVHARADRPSYRFLSSWAAKNGKPALPKTTVGDIIQGEFPRKEKMLVFLEACGVPANERKHWRAAWERIAAAEQRRQQDEAADLEQRRVRVLEEAKAQAKAQVGALIDKAHVRAEEIVAEAEQRADALRQRAEADVKAEKVSVAALAARLESCVQEEIALELAGERCDRLTALHGALTQYTQAEEVSTTRYGSSYGSSAYGAGYGSSAGYGSAHASYGSSAGGYGSLPEGAAPDGQIQDTTGFPDDRLPSVDELIAKIQSDRKRAAGLYDPRESEAEAMNSAAIEPVLTNDPGDRPAEATSQQVKAGDS
jgi:hypothetical protein